MLKFFFKGLVQITVQFMITVCETVIYELYRDSGFSDFFNLECFLASKSNH